MLGAVMAKSLRLCPTYTSGVAAHEFGHFIGLDDAYEEGTWRNLTGPDDIMAETSGRVDWYHARVLVEKYAR